MAAKFVAVVCVQFVLFNVLQAQVLNRIPGFPGMPGILPGFGGCGLGPMVPVTETVIPNQVYLPNYPAPVVEVPYGVETVVSNPSTTIIQDSTVANNLANALQLLVVSNLLSNTLNSNNEVIVPSYGPVEYGMVPSPYTSPCGYNSYNYVY